MIGLQLLFFYDPINEPKLVIAISLSINITKKATYQYKSMFDIFSLNEEMTN
jgi:hypothetical protein